MRFIRNKNGQVSVEWIIIAAVVLVVAATIFGTIKTRTERKGQDVIDAIK